MEVIVKQLEAKNGGYIFDVRVDENNSSTRHTVTMDDDYYTDLKTDTSPEVVIEQAFVFLLDKEPKEMILSRFDVTVISHYFPEFEDYIKDKVS